MPPKRKHEEPAGAIVYGADIPWLQPFRNPEDPADEASTHGSSIQTTLSSPDEIVQETAKLSYLLYHRLDSDDFLPGALSHIGVQPNTPSYDIKIREISKTYTKWKAAIVGKFLRKHVDEVVHKWRTSNARKSFEALGIDARGQIWMAEYDKDPESMVAAMWKPVIDALDLANVFNTELQDGQDRARMKGVRVMLRNKYIFGCEITFKHRSRKDMTASCTRDWMRYSNLDSFWQNIVPIEEVPVNPKYVVAPSVELDSEATEHGSEVVEHGSDTSEHDSKVAENDTEVADHHGAKALEHDSEATKDSSQAPEHVSKAAESDTGVLDQHGASEDGSEAMENDTESVNQHGSEASGHETEAMHEHSSKAVDEHESEAMEEHEPEAMNEFEWVDVDELDSENMDPMMELDDLDQYHPELDDFFP